VLGHQSLNLGKDPVRKLLVLVRKPGVNLDSIRDVGKEGRIWGNEVDAKIGMNGQTVKILLYLVRLEKRYNIQLFRVGSLMSDHNRRLSGPKSNKN
jgi:hypothetical protein